MALPSVIFANNASSRLYEAIDGITQTIRVPQDHGMKFPAPTGDQYFMVTIEDRRTGKIEICKATSRVNDIITVVRGQEDTEAQSFAMGATVANRLTAETMTAFFGYAYDQETSDERYANVSGDTMEGPLLLPPSMPTDNLEAAHKAYVDARVAAAGQVTVSAVVSLVYQVGNGVTEVSLTGLDIYDQTYLLNNTRVEPVDVFVNGVKKVLNNTGGVGEYSVDRSLNKIVFDSALPNSAFVAIDVYSPRDVPTGPVSMFRVAITPLPTGAETQFTLRKQIDNSPIDAVRSDEVLLYVNNVPQRPGTDYSVAGSLCTFSEAPEADAVIWGVWVKTSIG